MTSIFRIKTQESVICIDFFIKLIDFISKGKNMKDFTNLFSPRNFKKDDELILNCFLK